MKIWVDADACPVVIKNILFKAAERVKISLTLVANAPMRIPNSSYVDLKLVAPGFDVADNEIVKNVNSGDLVITADIPLAAEAIEKGAQVLNPRGDMYTEDNIRERLRIRDMLESLRGSGVDTGGPPPFNKKNQNAFASQLDKILNAYMNRA